MRTHKLNEDELRSIVRESVVKTLNEAGFFDRLRNGVGNIFKNRKKKPSVNPTSPEEEPESFQFNPDRNNWADNEGDENSSYVLGNDSNEDNQNDSHFIWDDNTNSHESTPNQNDFNQDDQPEPHVINGQPEQPQQPEEDSNNQPEPEPQPQGYQPYRVAGQGKFAGYDDNHNKQYEKTYYTEENEKVFTEQFVPAYNAINTALKQLSSLPQINGTELGDKLTYGLNGPDRINNMSAYNENMRGVDEEMKSLVDTLSSIKQKMKGALNVLGVKSSEDYQHYNMEESKLNQIIKNSINEVIKKNVS